MRLTDQRLQKCQCLDAKMSLKKTKTACLNFYHNVDYQNTLLNLVTVVLTKRVDVDADIRIFDNYVYSYYIYQNLK